MLLPVALATATACQLPTEPKAADGCRGEATFCDGRAVAPLGDADVRTWQDRANDYADTQYGAGPRAYPAVTWRACFFTVSGVCAAGWTESKTRIHVSTAEPERTGPLVAHETLHTRYWQQFGDPDASHRRSYGW